MGELPEPFRAVLEANAPTFLDEQRDPTSGSIDAAALARTTVPLMFTYGTEGPRWYRAIIAELTLLVPAARVVAITGAGHIPHATHPDQWVATLLAFHQTIALPTRGRDERRRLDIPPPTGRRSRSGWRAPDRRW